MQKHTSHSCICRLLELCFFGTLDGFGSKIGYEDLNAKESAKNDQKTNKRKGELPGKRSCSTQVRNQ
jgi:hypothetical protein